MTNYQCKVCKGPARQVPGGFVHNGPRFIGTRIREVNELSDEVIPISRVSVDGRPAGPKPRAIRVLHKGRKVTSLCQPGPGY